MINNNTTTAKIIIMMTVNGTAWRGRAQFRTNSDGRVLENEAEALMNFARRYVAALSHRSSKSRVENIRLSIVVLKDAWEGTSALILHSCRHRLVSFSDQGGKLCCNRHSPTATDRCDAMRHRSSRPKRDLMAVLAGHRNLGTRDFVWQCLVRGSCL